MARIIPERQTTTYRVHEGDTLSSIARQQTGSSDYAALYELNRDLIGDNPNNITAGMVLTIPGGSVDTAEVDW